MTKHHEIPPGFKPSPVGPIPEDGAVTRLKTLKMEYL
jgi:hypothetical protein